jgi:CheY-like chemotaxis protein
LENAAGTSASAHRLARTAAEEPAVTPGRLNPQRARANGAECAAPPPKDDPSPHVSSDYDEAELLQRNLRVLVAEDNPADVRLIREALAHHGIAAEFLIHQDGEAMISYVDRIDAGEAPCPDLVLLDLNLPRQGGHIVLARLRQSASCAEVPVIVVTSSNAPRDRETAAKYGASGYFRKPIDYDEFLLLGSVVKQVIGRHSSH